MNINDITITSLDDIAGFDISTGIHLFTLDELQNASIANSEEKQNVTGKQGRKLNSLKKNKAVVVSGTNGMVSGALAETQVGSKFENKATEVMWTDYLTVTENKATTLYKAVGTEGAEIINLYVKDSNGAAVESLTQGAEAAGATASGTFTYNPATKELNFSGVNDGTEIVVYYKRKVQANVLENLSDSYSKKCTLYINATGEDKCNNVYRLQFYIPRADFSGEFSWEMGDNQTVHAFQADSLAGGCGTNALWTYTIFGVNAVDAAN